jgi:hypothetical protein
MSSVAVISEVLQSPLIVHIEVVSEDLGEWHWVDGGWPERDDAIGVRLLQVLRGSLDTAEGDVVALEVIKRGTYDGLVLDYYGIWTHVSTTPGTELVAFCDGASRDLRVALTDEHCDKLVPAETMLAELRLALSLEAKGLTPDALLLEAARNQTDVGELFARYIWARTRDAVVGSADRFKALMQIAEDPRTHTEARETYLLAAYEDATFTEELPSVQRARLARSMFRTALDPGSGALRQRLLDTFIPNLVEAEAPEPLSTSDVFGNQPDLAERVLGDVADPNTSAYSDKLQSWLSTEGHDR